jgi:hypothetical protein
MNDCRRRRGGGGWHPITLHRQGGDGRGAQRRFRTARPSLAEAASSIGAIEELMREQDEALRSLLEQVLSEVCES